MDFLRKYFQRMWLTSLESSTSTNTKSRSIEPMEYVFKMARKLIEVKNILTIISNRTSKFQWASKIYSSFKSQKDKFL